MEVAVLPALVFAFCIVIEVLGNRFGWWERRH